MLDPVYINNNQRPFADFVSSLNDKVPRDRMMNDVTWKKK